MKLVVGVAVYKFEMKIGSEGEVEPEFRLLSSEFTDNTQDLKVYEILTINDLFGIYYNHTAGLAGASTFSDKPTQTSNFFIGRLKETHFKVISYFRESIDDSQYLTIAIFKLDEDIEIFEEIIQILAGRMDLIFEKLAKGNQKSVKFISSIQEEIQNEIKFAIFQIDRLSNLSKVQKVGLIYIGPERFHTLELLRDGPVSRFELQFDLQKMKENANIDQVLKPFTELNLIRRDWAKGYKDKKKGITLGQGEYIFLIKDVILVRKPPKEIITQMKKDQNYGPKYIETLNEFYAKYDPSKNYNEESKLLANFIINPDIYDLLALLSSRTYLREKMPKVLSEFSDIDKVLDRLIEAEIITQIEDASGRKWLCLLAEISPITIFPEFLIPKIQKYVVKKGENIDFSKEQRILTNEVAKMALNLLESSYNEKIEF